MAVPNECLTSVCRLLRPRRAMDAYAASSGRRVTAALLALACDLKAAVTGSVTNEQENALNARVVKALTQLEAFLSGSFPLAYRRRLQQPLSLALLEARQCGGSRAATCEAMAGRLEGLAWLLRDELTADEATGAPLPVHRIGVGTNFR